MVVVTGQPEKVPTLQSLVLTLQPVLQAGDTLQAVDALQELSMSQGLLMPQELATLQTEEVLLVRRSRKRFWWVNAK